MLEIVISRKQALRLGLKTYYTGVPCRYGHVSERLTSNLTCGECNRLKAQKWGRENKERAKARFDRWYSDPENAARVSEDAQAWSRRNPEKRREIVAANHAFRRKARLKLSPEHQRELDRIYRDCPPGHQVDHVVPLRGRLVSGLHVPWNLQYLADEANRRKSNRFDATDLVTSR